MSGGPPYKRQRLDEDVDLAGVRRQRSAFLSSLSRPVSPPATQSNPAVVVGAQNVLADVRNKIKSKPLPNGPKKASEYVEAGHTLVRSPIQLTKVRGLSSGHNVDTISLHDLLGDPLIKKAHIFNFCFQVDWMMRHFDSDVRNLVEVKIVHGSWRDEDGNRIGIEQDLEKWKNVKQIRAWLPDMFGTHHSKMMVLIRHDDTAQIVIHTANMLEKDWDHMTQAVWRSPMLPKGSDSEPSEEALVGSGERFKYDLLRYFKAYGIKLKDLVQEISEHDFSSIRAALVASTPSRPKPGGNPGSKWGHLSLQHTIRAGLHNSVESASKRSTPHLVCQVSSIATLPAKWFESTILAAASGSKNKVPTYSIIYPTPDDMRSSLTGYATGGSIHTKIASAAQLKQVDRLRPSLCRWGGDQENEMYKAHRHQVPPHIKTYICFAEQPTAQKPTPNIDWALLTSANLSQQAWGEIAKLPKGSNAAPEEAESKVASYEIGVLVWPQLFAENEEPVTMVPVFGHDMPAKPNETVGAEGSREVVVGLRMPYDLPLTKYGSTQLPWSPSATYSDPDRLGQTWD